MRILFITDNFPPEVNAPATRTYEHCMEWIKDENVEITVITCAPNFPHGKLFEGYKNKFYQRENVNGIEVIRVWSYITHNSGFMRRVLDYMSFSFMAFVVGLFQKHDVLIATSPQFFTTWSAWAINKIKRKPWIFELRDIWPESIRTVGAMRKSIVLNFLEKIELALYRDANRVVAVTNAFRENLVRRGIDREKIDVVTNGSNIELFSPQKKDASLLRRYNLEDKFIVGYIGTHGMAHSLDFIIKSIPKIQDRDIHFLFIGDGAMKQKIKAIAQSLNLKNITFLDAIAKERVPRHLSICDISLTPLKKDDNFKTVIPSKIFEASAMQKPTLLGVEGEAEDIINKYKAGVCFEPENEGDFIEKLLLLKNREFYKKCQVGCSELAHDYDRRKLAGELLKIIREVKVKHNIPKKNELGEWGRWATIHKGSS
jgi:glycosyltransferase involved in cell wall biosynthesis